MQHNTGSANQSFTGSFPNGANFIISTNSPGMVDNSQQAKPSYIIPVSMKLMNNSGQPIVNPQTGAINQNVLNAISNTILNGLHQNNNSPFLIQQQQSKINANDSSINTPTTIGNILIKTMPSSPNNTEMKTASRSGADQVDLLKDLLIKNLNATTTNSTNNSDSNYFFGLCVKCNEKIMGIENGLKAMDNLFHVTCFVCFGCSKRRRKK